MKQTQFIVVWILITLVLVAIFLLPIYNYCGDRFHFYLSNGLCIIIAVTFTRFMFFLDYHWFAHNTPVRVLLTFAVIPVILYLVDSQYEFQRYLDEEGIQTWLAANATDLSFCSFIRNEYLFFLIWAILACIFLPFKMIRSIWRDYKAKLK